MLARRDLTSTALQIYLVQVQKQTEYFVREAQETSIITGFSTKYVPVDSPRWEEVVKAAKKLLDYIQKCIKAFETRRGRIVFGFTALCAIDSAQDCLRGHLLENRSNEYDHRKNYSFIGSAYRWRAKLISNALAATHKNDQILSDIWLELAEVVREDISLNRKCTNTVDKAIDCLELAISTERKLANEGSEWSETHKMMYQRAAHHYRHAAARAPFKRLNSHRRVAKLYLEAASICAGLTNSVDDEKLMYEQAVESMKHAAELAAAHVEGTVEAHLEPAVRSAASKARKLVLRAPKIRDLCLVLHYDKKAAAKAREGLAACRHNALLPAWQTLVREQDEVVEELQNLLWEAMDCAQKVKLGDRVFDGIRGHTRTRKGIICGLETCYDRTTYYKQKALQALQGARPSQLAHKCWAQAAVRLEAVVKKGLDHLLSGAFARKDEYNSYPDWYPHSHRAETFANIAEHVQEGVSEYLDRARGAEALHRDPREAVWWREAAKWLEQRMKEMFEEMESEIEPTSAIWAAPPERFRAGYKSEQKEKAFREAAEYLDFGFKHRALSNAETRQNGTRVAVLYEHLAPMVVLGSDGGSNSNASSVDMNKVVDCLVKLIAIYNASEPVSAEVKTIYKCVCTYAARLCGRHVASAPSGWENAHSYLDERARDSDCDDRRRPRCDASESSESVRLHYDFERMGSDSDCSYISY